MIETKYYLCYPLIEANKNYKAADLKKKKLCFFQSLYLALCLTQK